MKIPKANMEKIQKALEFCDFSLQNLFKILDEVITDTEEKENFKHLILTKTYFAGGVFRSIFTKRPVKDIDIFFIDDESALEFTHMVMNNNNLSSKVFSRTDYYTFNFDKLSFITHNTGKPDDLIQNFDLTINQHYYRPFNSTMCFNSNTFDKKGHVNIFAKEIQTNPTNVLHRAIRFLKEGFDISDDSINDTLLKVLNYKRKVKDFLDLNLSSSNVFMHVNPTNQSLYENQTKYRQKDFYSTLLGVKESTYTETVNEGSHMYYTTRPADTIVVTNTNNTIWDFPTPFPIRTTQ